jgi:RNA 2',3'-cyclic 3'-phosphodiesterase
MPASTSAAARGPSPIRGFVAVNFSGLLRQALAGVIGPLVNETPPRTIKWVEAEIIHLTLKFLGDVPPAGIRKIVEALTDSARGLAAFEFTAGGLGCFPNARKPRVVWIGVDEAGAEQMKRLQSAVEAALAPLGYPPEARPFAPHITLGRVRREAAPRDAARAGEVIAAQPVSRLRVERVEAIYLMKSELRPSGPIYTPLFQARLANH